MLRKMLGWGGGDVITFLALAHMLDATQDAGLGWGRWSIGVEYETITNVSMD